MIQQYFCPVCRFAGEVEIRKHAGAFEALQILASDHAAKNPNCRAKVAALRVRNPELCSPQQWADLILMPEDRG